MERLNQTYKSIIDGITNESEEMNKPTSAAPIGPKNDLSDGNYMIIREERTPALVQLYESRRNVPSNSNYSVFKICGLSHETDNWDLINYFYPIHIPNSHSAPYFTECVHLVMNSMTGKYDAFIELPTKTLAKGFYNFTGSKRFMHGDLLTIQLSTQEELIRALFPRHKLNSTEDGSNIVNYLTRFEINTLLNRCREIRVLIPANLVPRISKIQGPKPTISELAIEAIKSTYKTKDYSNLMTRLVRATLAVPLFTEKQKTMILCTAHMKCPQDMVEFVYLPTEQVQSHSDASPDFVRSRQSSGTTLQQSDSSAEIAKLKQKVFVATKAYQELYLQHQKILQELQALNDMYRRLTRSYDILEKYCNQLQAEQAIQENNFTQVGGGYAQTKSKRTFVDNFQPDESHKSQTDMTLKWIESQKF
ncbi:hypothetical protein HDV06_000211 [Boothiomyces sp. JEL0866]|nr:hypothetical protein HDV06_000211 [Boothiomyces sp. JEL0866]